jgi:hypothetical protein
MMTNCDKGFERLIDGLLLGEDPPQQWEKLRSHMRGCEPCRSRYNRVVLAERMLHGGPDHVFEPSSFELDHIGQALFPPEKTTWQRMVQWFAPAPRQARYRWLTGLAMAATAVVLIPLLARAPMNARPPAPEKEAFQSRGAHPTDARQAGLRAFCLEGEKVQALDAKGTLPPRCDRSSQLKLAVSNPGNYRSVFLVGMDDDHAPKWYAPTPPAAESVSAPAGVSETPVGGAVRIAVNHGPGRVRIFALFSDKPIRTPEVESAVDELAKRHVTAAEAAALPLHRADVLQRSLLVEIAP